MIASATDIAREAGPSGRALARDLLSRYALVLIWAVMALFFWAMRPGIFGTPQTFSSIFGGQQVVIILAMAVLITTVVGEIDLSFAAVMGLTATTIPVLAGVHGWPMWAACLAGLAVAAVCGAVNAWFVVGQGLNSLVVTLGMATLLQGVAQMVSGNTIVSIVDPGFAKIALFRIAGMPLSFYYCLLLALVIFYVLGWTPLGRSMIFIGTNPEVARLAGIRVAATRFGAYVVSAVLSGAAGILLVASVGGFDSGTTMSYLLPPLAAVFLSTAVVQPGRFNPIGTLIAIWFLTTGIFGLQLMGATGWIQNVFYGGALVVAIALSKFVRDRARARA